MKLAVHLDLIQIGSPIPIPLYRQTPDTFFPPRHRGQHLLTGQTQIQLHLASRRRPQREPCLSFLTERPQFTLIRKILIKPGGLDDPAVLQHRAVSVFLHNFQRFANLDFGRAGQRVPRIALM